MAARFVIADASDPPPLEIAMAYHRIGLAHVFMAPAHPSLYIGGASKARAFATFIETAHILTAARHGGDPRYQVDEPEEEGPFAARRFADA